MKKVVILLLFVVTNICFLSTTVQAQMPSETQQIDSIKYIGTTTDSLLFIVHSTILGGVGGWSQEEGFYRQVEYIGENDSIKVNILYTQEAQADCYCHIQTSIKIKKNVYEKAIVNVKIRYIEGVTPEREPIFNDYGLLDSKEINLMNVRIDKHTISNKIFIFPNPVHNVFHIKLEDNKTVNLEIYNPQRSLLLSKDITSDKEIDISFLPSGLYFVVVDRKQISHIIKE